MQRLHGGSGTRAIARVLRPGDAVLNDTQNEYEINYSYSTVANGGADRIAIQPGEVAWLRSSGGASDFAKWDIGQPDELPDTVNIRNLSTIA